MFQGREQNRESQVFFKTRRGWDGSPRIQLDADRTLSAQKLEENGTSKTTAVGP